MTLVSESAARHTLIADEPLTVENAPARAAAFLQNVLAYPNTFEGRGIVICAGGVRYLTSAWVLINMLRQHGCTLPIEIWYLGEKEYDPNWAALVERLGVRHINACDVNDELSNPHPHLGGWESKAFAILHCRFEEVLLLDADNVPVVDPTFLFETPEYQATGTIFWPDCGRAGMDRPYWQAFGVAFRDEWEQESGQIVIDKRRSWRALCLCDWYNRNSDFFYRHVYGDKDTFRLAWHFAGQCFAMPPKIDWGSFWIRQADFQGNLLFQHRNGDKWSLAGNRKLRGFVHQEECSAYVHELYLKWPVLHFLAGPISETDRAVAASLAGKPLRFERLGHNRWPIELSATGIVAKGRSQQAFFWWVRDEQLLFAGGDGNVAYRLRHEGGGKWTGVSASNPRMLVCLESA